MPGTKIIDLPAMPNLEFEKQLWEEGFRIIAGLDEAGRGAWAGPVYAAAVILPNDERILDLLSGVRDSKMMTSRQRERWKDCIRSASIAWAVGSATNDEIDEIGILPATCLAMQRALDEFRNPPHHLLVDYIEISHCACPQLSIPKGDCRSLSIAAASVLAKTSRDACMLKMDEKYPEYGFARHKGYGTALHQRSLLDSGPCEIHRKTFRPIREIILAKKNENTKK
jgi:ribonuclease HII